MKLFTDSIEEIQQDSALRFYGMILSLTHALAAGWWFSENLIRFMTSETEAICWPFLKTCDSWRFLNGGQAVTAIGFYAVFSIIVAILFVFPSLFKWPKTIGAAYFGLIALNIAKIFFLSLDFRLRQNQHYMAAFLSLTFLFLPRKRDQLRILIPFFYFWAGLLKLNTEWLSGSSLYGNIWFLHGFLLPVACTYVVILELILVWGLLARNPIWFWSTWAQLLAAYAADVFTDIIQSPSRMRSPGLGPVLIRSNAASM